MSETIIKHPCGHCGHSPDDHAFDDALLVEMADAPWEDRPFRCLGPGHRGCNYECPDFTGLPITIVES